MREEEPRIIREHNCDDMQGYLYSPPVPAPFSYKFLWSTMPLAVDQYYVPPFGQEETFFYFQKNIFFALRCCKMTGLVVDNRLRLDKSFILYEFQLSDTLLLFSKIIN